ncbi:MAG: ROK family protein [Thermogemmatispora sp.]|uniref:ROK family protein n=1 Tax=Thermogemmatispora sp. TaxID=1968838 RepID=UPI00262DBC57|nr:ROK family protein [Thermogemmatispora sp.]MBX5458542.1 ROK family protein [Thermogemmatispora sp.]
MELGIDVGGTKIQGAYLTATGEVALTPRLRTPASYEEFLGTLARLVHTVAQQQGEPVVSIGLGLPGTCTRRRSLWVPNLPFLHERELAAELEQRLGAAVVLSNDAQLALLGEAWRGAARGRQQVALVSVGTGVGGALMLGGQLVQGAHGSAGAFGWLTLDRGHIPDPEHGFLELVASGSALAARGQQLDPPLTSYEVIAQARQGQPDCLALVEEMGHMLGLALASIASLFDPELIIITGGLCEAFDLFSPLLRRNLARYGAPAVRETPIVPALLGDKAAAYGALRAALLRSDFA